MTIASSHFVYCVAMPGTGKTFTGDYLDLIHGFHHVDGDLAFRSQYTPEMREAFTKMVEGIHRHPILKDFMKDVKSSDDLAELEEYWGPLFQVRVDSALEAAKTNDKVVITFADGFQVQRDFVFKKLKEGGAKNITLLCLSMDQDKKLESLYHRTVRQAEAMGITVGDVMRLCGWEGKGEPTMEVSKSFMSQPGAMGNCVFEDLPSHAKIVDVTNRDVTNIDGIDAALGLFRSGEESYDEIVKQVVAMDHKRDEENPYSATLFPEIEKEVKEALANANTDKERKQIKRRASSLIKLELMTGRLSITSTSSDSNANESENMRRSSLISTGKIE